ncbi:MAG: PAS domain-containing sensor histidine kinase [Daejeonella sp.]
MENLNAYKELVAELNEVRLKLEESNDTLEAIRLGEIDALVVKNKESHHIYTLKSADQTYRIFIEQMTEGAVTLNDENLILYSNSQFARMIGLPLEKVIGQTLDKFIVREQQSLYDSMITKAWDTNIKGELKLKTANGDELPVLISLKTLNLDDGVSMSIILTDLSKQKEIQKLLQKKNQQLEEAQKIAQELNVNLENTVEQRTSELEINIKEKIKVEEDLRSNQERLTRILETMAEGVGIVDLEGRLTYSNPMAQKILGLGNSEPITTIYGNDKWMNLKVDGSPLPNNEHPVAIMIATNKEVYDHEIAVQPRNGERFYISINAAPLYDRYGVLVGGVGTFMDVTNRRKISQQKDEFISIASHELKTPLTSLKASMQLLTRIIATDPHSEKIPEFIDKANKNLVKILYLTEDLMNVSKIQQGPLPLHKTTFNLGKLINECCSHVKADNTYKFVVEGDYNVDVNADFHRIDQVLVNLVNNAIKYAPDSKTILFTVVKNDVTVKVSVQDFGIGISPEKLPHLFDRYYRVDPSGIQFSGLGLGLYICAEIIERHGGKMGVNSDKGKGSTFWFTLPLE